MPGDTHGEDWLLLWLELGGSGWHGGWVHWDGVLIKKNEEKLKKNKNSHLSLFHHFMNLHQYASSRNQDHSHVMIVVRL